LEASGEMENIKAMLKGNFNNTKIFVNQWTRFRWNCSIYDFN